MAKNVIHSVCASASVPLIAKKMLLLASFIDIEDLCTLYNAILYRPTSSSYAYINGNHMLELLN